MDGYPKESRNSLAGIIDLRAQISGLLSGLNVHYWFFPILTDLIYASEKTPERPSVCDNICNMCSTRVTPETRLINY